MPARQSQTRRTGRSSFERGQSSAGAGVEASGSRAVDDKSNEITAMHELLAGLMLHGRVITGDALLTQQEVARTITSCGGDYLMVVKENQPTLRRDIADLFATADATPHLLADTIETA